jgi:hypothetical protein
MHTQDDIAHVTSAKVGVVACAPKSQKSISSNKRARQRERVIPTGTDVWGLVHDFYMEIC